MELCSFPAGYRVEPVWCGAGGVLPAGSTIAGSTASHERIILSGAVEAGNQGSDTFVYDPKAGTWLAVPTRLSASKVSLASGAVLATPCTWRAWTRSRKKWSSSA